MKRMLRRLVGIKSAIARDEAIALARKHVETMGWPWQEPLMVQEGITTFWIMTNADYRGGNVNIHLKVDDGSIVSSAFARR